MIITEEIRLSPEDIPEELLKKAREARAHSYAPYSKYRVSAALSTSDGQIFTGVNVENCAYPTSMCAERNALAAAVGQGHRKFECIAIVTPPDENGNPGSPCGACRQALAEFGTDLVVYLATPDDDSSVRVRRLNELLPDAFTPRNL